MAEKTIYCGSGKKQNSEWLKCTINPDKIMDYIQTYEGNKFVKLNINIKDKPDQYGKDVSISVDTWAPDKGKALKNDKENKVTPEVEDDGDSLPF